MIPANAVFPFTETVGNGLFLVTVHNRIFQRSLRAVSMDFHPWRHGENATATWLFWMLFGE